MMDKKQKYFTDEYGDIWVRVSEGKVMRLRDDSEGIWNNGKGLTYIESPQKCSHCGNLFNNPLADMCDICFQEA